MKFLKNKYSKVMLGLLWGFGLACIFRCACNGRKCIIYKAPKPADVKNKVYSHDEKCYKYETVSTNCNENPVEN
jgi:hypothetical protein